MLNQAVRVAEEAWVDRKKQIEADTQVTIETSKEAIADSTKESKKKLADLHKKIEDGNADYLKQHQEQENNLSKLSVDIEELERAKKVLFQTNSDLSHENIELKSLVKINKEELSDITSDKETTLKDIVGLRETQTSIKGEISEDNETLKLQKTNLINLKEDIKQLEESWQTDLKTLEGKKQKLLQDIMSNQDQNNKVMENLANWSKKLEDKDENLRIREAQVNEKEKSIARNYNLLNL
jgi:chromosome segregation ATPase